MFIYFILKRYRTTKKRGRRRAKGDFRPTTRGEREKRVGRRRLPLFLPSFFFSLLLLYLPIFLISHLSSVISLVSLSIPHHRAFVHTPTPTPYAR